MRMMTGALLLVGAEQAYAHANLIQFPNHVEARTVLFPTALAFLVLGTMMTLWGALTEGRTPRLPPAGSSHST